MIRVRLQDNGEPAWQKLWLRIPGGGPGMYGGPRKNGVTPISCQTHRLFNSDSFCVLPNSRHISYTITHIFFMLRWESYIGQGSRMRYILCKIVHKPFNIYFFHFRAAPAAYGSSQARGRIGATAASLHHSHSNARSEPYLQTISQLTAVPDPKPTE